MGAVLRPTSILMFTSQKAPSQLTLLEGEEGKEGEEGEEGEGAEVIDDAAKEVKELQKQSPQAEAHNMHLCYYVKFILCIQQTTLVFYRRGTPLINRESLPHQ